ncbi:MAG: ADP-forming succinate--CoA ligase subunit beta [Candidatus Krumholzibacteriota bacterium]|nr:ADP-forming succinate--CoA ligase subunit beta [Candidatus Krumholzibacteriota bacterium]
MKIHEGDARGIFTRFGLPVPPSCFVTEAEDAGPAAEDLGCPVVVKAQVLVGGRGKAGGVKLASSPAEAVEKAKAILGMDIKGLKVEKILIAKAVDISEEFYVGMVVDRVTRKPLMMISPAGGIDIEEVARSTPEKILKVVIDPVTGLLPFQTRKMASFLTSDKDVAKQLSPVFRSLYEAFMEIDSSLAEINPLVVSPDGKVWAIDAKINIDDNSLYRHKEIEALRDDSAEDAGEVEAREADLSFVKLDGNIGCIVNGAGLAMATMDMIKYYGAEPANFLDIGGSSNPEKVLSAMKIILRDEKVKAILINIFGGITRCDDVARGLLEAREKLGIDVPLVVRLTGTNEKEARELLEDTELESAATMDEGVKKAIEIAGS